MSTGLLRHSGLPCLHHSLQCHPKRTRPPTRTQPFPFCPSAGRTRGSIHETFFQCTVYLFFFTTAVWCAWRAPGASGRRESLEVLVPLQGRGRELQRLRGVARPLTVHELLPGRQRRKGPVRKVGNPSPSNTGSGTRVPLRWFLWISSFNHRLISWLWI